MVFETVNYAIYATLLLIKFILLNSFKIVKPTILEMIWLKSDSQKIILGAVWFSGKTLAYRSEVVDSNTTHGRN